MLPSGWELFAILAVLVLLFGATKLPQMARSLGQSARVFKAETRGMKEDDEAANKQKESQAEQQRLGSSESKELGSTASTKDTAPKDTAIPEETRPRDSRN